MLLTIDVGNTFVKFAALRGEAVAGAWRATSDRERTADEWAVHVAGFLALAGLARAEVTGCAIASVVPTETEALAAMARQLFDVEPLVVSARLNLGLPLDYPRPEEVGVDRLVGAVAAAHRFGAPVIVVDFGTATTFSVVDGRGAFVGGAIAPGLEGGQAALAGRAARLFTVPLEFPPTVIGHSTVEAMQSGLMWGTISLVEGLGTRLQHELGQLCPVIATGGLAARIAPHTGLFSAVVPELKHEGLRLIWERNRKDEKRRTT